MSINPNDLDRIRQLSLDHLRDWMAGQKSASRYHQAAKNELARRVTRAVWIKWGVFAWLAVLTLFLSLYSMFVRE
ncbi:MAG: hypothetical protein K0S58_1289 [Nitrospira sp.]|jgi:hypothetical protein|nr:hypothetical protein [Nitrospira sp.]